ncbi:hypothetical protein ESA94_05905 [Lacibacter luteus]|uniref:Uncharacterized protein n=1 Tax=Lacibacter luteus TaxID=2508719 RepID=A0A4Q1CN73_9BACT|nr:hypothetical protein [Lacibacter luteus]RXK62533.1 hypothetical protein ESA94_05905 [Lacibacter luteus]
MSDLVVSKRVRQLRFFAIITLILSVIEILLITGYTVYSGTIPENYLVYLKWLFVISDILLVITVFRLVRLYYPSRALSIRIQYIFLILAYLSVFGIVVYLAWLYNFIDLFFTIEPIVSEFEMSEDLFPVLLFFAFVLIKISSLVYTQVNGFRLIKEIRKNYRDSLVETSDLL